jgi:hypothetical protein
MQTDDPVEPNVEVTPTETVFELYECPNGHRQSGSGETTATSQLGKVSTGAMCVACWFASLGERFPTAKVSE